MSGRNNETTAATKDKLADQGEELKDLQPPQDCRREAY